MLFNRLFAKPNRVTASYRAAMCGVAVGLAAFALTSGSAYAADATGNVDIGGMVPGSCTWSGGTGNVSLVIPNFVDLSARLTVNNTARAVLGTISCSGPAHIYVKTTTGGLKNSAAPGAGCDAAGNATCVNYKAVATWSVADPLTVTLHDTAGMASATVTRFDSTSAAATGHVSIDVTPLAPAGNPPLNAGSFTDVAVVGVMSNSF